MEALVLVSSVDKNALKEVLSVAQERIKEQEAWNQLSVKVPEYAPCTPCVQASGMGSSESSGYL